MRRPTGARDYNIMRRPTDAGDYEWCMRREYLPSVSVRTKPQQWS